MKFKFLKILLIASLVLKSVNSYSQARSSIGISYGPNLPFSNIHQSGSGFQVMGAIAITNKWSIIPNLGYEGLDLKRDYTSSFNDQFVNPYNSINLFYVGASARYTFNNLFFAKAGPIAYAAGANEDVANFGIGGNLTGGMDLNLDAHNTIQIAAYLSGIYIDKSVGNGVTPYTGLKFAYVFNFSRLR
jgi:hypothetical protein